MGVRARLLSAAASDMGRRRTNNEDRYYVDPDYGIFAVIDGVGGQAAGEHAAETAVEVLRERLQRQSGSPEERLREAIALANNEIYRQGRSRVDWNGMACVLTVALIEDDEVTVGHVGDSRLYLLRPGEITKITHDHSPVGEREDRGEIGEEEAMRHARRNEIYRDLGSSERDPHDTSFIEIASFPLPSDGALLLCSDGLSDLIGSAEIRAGVERYAPDYDRAIQALVEAANHAGGKDNITIVVVASPGYNPQPADESVPAKPKRARKGLSPWLAAAAGLILGILLGLLIPLVRSQFSVGGPVTLLVGAAGINAALGQAHSGDTVIIPEGKYRERVQLREGVTVRAQQAATVTLLSPDGGPVVAARGLAAASIGGVWIQGDLQAPASVGIEVIDSTVTISNVRVTGVLTGIDIKGASSPLITSSQIANNLGAGIDVGAGSSPRIENNLIAANGNGKPGVGRPGVEVEGAARPILKDNGIVDNAAEAIWIHAGTWAPADFAENFFGKLTPAKAIRVLNDAAGGARP
ncbi:MAG: protein phosphatase 2C domain-containing protein [Acidobacteriota bacterium]|nr:protein phosphatase 2C domain-containing protein [Acidobacteriota bacterium]